MGKSRRRSVPGRGPDSGQGPVNASGNAPTRGRSAAERRELLDRMKREEQRRQRRRTIIPWSIAAVVLAGLVVAVAIPIVQQRQQEAATDQAVQTYTVTSRNHVEEPVTYPQSPAVGGDHSPIWLNCGSYTGAVPEMSVVHSLEHGAVWITYRSNLAGPAVSTIQQLTDQPYIVTSPYASLPAPIVASAWGKQLKINSPDDPKLKNFITSYRIGPQTPEPGAACTGGTDAGIPRANA